MPEPPPTSVDRPHRRRRDRPTLVCLACHRRKLKCNKQRPCNQCSRNNPPLTCEYAPAAVTKKLSAQRLRKALSDSRDPGAGPSLNLSQLTCKDESESGNRSRSPSSSVRSISAPVSTIHVRQGESPDGSCAEAKIPASCPQASECDAETRFPCGFRPPEQGDGSLAHLVLKRTWYGRTSTFWLLPKFKHCTHYLSRAGLVMPNGEFTTFNELKLKLFQHRSLYPGESQDSSLSIIEEIPQRETTDLLVGRYFDTFGSIFSFLDQPAFRVQVKEYWEAPECASFYVCIQILLVVAIGNASLRPADGRIAHTKILAWWHLVLAWQGTALRSDPSDIKTMQACCLVAMMRYVYGLDVIGNWPTSGMLVRNAMMAGLHRDPSLTDHRWPPEELPIRQYLWYAILEFDLQSSMDEGMQPTLDPGDWDMPFPDTTGSPRDILISSLPLRIRIAHFLNHVKCSDDYDEALLLDVCLKEQAHTLLSYAPLQDERSSTGTFVHDTAAILCRRSLMALHLPFALLKSPSHAYSHNLCMTTAIALLERLDPPPDHNADADALVVLMRTSSSMFQTVAFQAIMYICFQLECSSVWDYQPWALVAELRDRLMAIVERYIVISEERLTFQDFVGKTFMVPSMVLAHARLARSGLSKEEVVARDETIAEEVMVRCFNLFRSRPDLPAK